MLILAVLVATIFFLLFGVYLKKKRRDPGIPMMSDCKPIIGHLHLFMGDNISMFKLVERISMAAVQNGGCIGVSFGITKFYCVTDPDDCEVICKSCPEKHYIYSFSKPWLGDGLVSADVEKWHVNKKLLYPMFLKQNLNKYLTVFNKQGRRLVKQFSEHVGKGAFNHEHYALLINLETIFQTALGLNIGEQVAQNKTYVNAINKMMDIIAARIKKVWLHFDAVFAISTLKNEQNQHLAVIKTLATEVIRKRKLQLNSSDPNIIDNSGDFSSFMDKLIRISKQTNNFDDQQVLDEINTLIVAGYDTTANILIYSLMLLGHHQDVQEKVFKEIEEVFGDSDRDVDKYDIIKLLYLEAFLKETLRLFTIAPMFGRKVTRDLKLKNYTLPAGTDCFVSLYGLHRNPEWGVDAEVFNPDRWMNPETIPKNPNLYAPFGMRVRYCVGKVHALMSLKTTLIHVLRHYRITCDINKVVHQIMLLMKPASGQHIILEHRKC